MYLPDMLLLQGSMSLLATKYMYAVLGTSMITVLVSLQSCQSMSTCVHVVHMLIGYGNPLHQAAHMAG